MRRRSAEPEETPEHAIRCPWCNAPKGQRCTTQRGRPLSIPSHDARITTWTALAAAQAAQAEQETGEAE